MKLSSFVHILSLLAFALLISGCVQQRAISGPEGQLSILDPTASMDASWVMEGGYSGKFGIEEIGGRKALFLINGEDSYRIIRRTKASLLTTPFLTWEWSLRAFLGENHPIRIVVGFQGKGHENLGWGNDLPDHSRILTVGWSRTPQQQDRLFTKKSAAHYIIGGGAPPLSTWRAEVADLASLYTRAWPGDEQTNTQITFIGLLVDEGQPATRGHIARLWLAR